MRCKVSGDVVDDNGDELLLISENVDSFKTVWKPFRVSFFQ